MAFLTWIYTWCWTNGVPGNLAASTVCLVLGYTVGLRKHIKRTAEIHAHLLGKGVGGVEKSSPTHRP